MTARPSSGAAATGPAGGRRVPASPRSRVPTLREERRLLREGHRYVAGVDEVGRGALAGPVTVGVVVVDAAARSAPSGVRDSKLLTPAAREALVPKLRRWAVGYAVGHAEPEEIDSYGIIAALRLAGRRALAQLAPTPPTCVLLDGSHDWLTVPAEPVGLFELDLLGRRPAPPVAVSVEPVVTTMVKADLRCAAVAAASVLAKVERDAIMTGRAEDFPLFGWRENKGYSAPEHVAALRRYGPCTQHRRTWSLPVAQVLAAGGLQVELLDEGTCDEDALDGGVLDGGALEQVSVGGTGGDREDPGRRADGVALLRHDGAVVR